MAGWVSRHFALGVLRLGVVRKNTHYGIAAVPGPSGAGQRQQSAPTGEHRHPALAWASPVDLPH